MLIVKKTGKHLWTKYTSDTIQTIGNDFININPSLDEFEIDKLLLDQLSDEAKKTLTQKQTFKQINNGPLPG